MPVGARRIHANRALGVAAAHRIKAIAAPLERIGIALYLFGNVGDRPRRLPVRRIAQRVDGEGRLIVAELDVRMHQARAVAERDVLGRRLGGETRAEKRGEQTQ